MTGEEHEDEETGAGRESFPTLLSATGLGLFVLETEDGNLSGCKLMLLL